MLYISRARQRQAAQRLSSDAPSSPSDSPSCDSSDGGAEAAAHNQSPPQVFSLPPTPSPIRVQPPPSATSPPYDRKKYSGVDVGRSKYLSEEAGGGRVAVIAAHFTFHISPQPSLEPLQATSPITCQQLHIKRHPPKQIQSVVALVPPEQVGRASYLTS